MLADLVAEILGTEFYPRRRVPGQPLTNAEKCARWRAKNSGKWNAYRRLWREKRKAE